MKLSQVKYITAATPHDLEVAVNACLRQDNRWSLQGSINVYDKPNVAEDRMWVQTLLRYVDASELDVDTRATLANKLDSSAR